MSDTKPRVRIAAGDVDGSTARNSFATNDSFQNFTAQLGYGTSNQMSGSTYGFNPITRNRTLLEWAYRGSWIVGVAVDAVAADMTRAGVEIMSGMKSSDIELLQIAMQELHFWDKLNETIRWSRLYGGAIAVMLIDGQDPQSPLNMDSIGPGQFKGLAVFDRWMLDATLNLQGLVQELGPDAGFPTYYKVIQSAPILGGRTIHYSRVIRIDGIELPFFQRMTENGWGISIIERLYDRLLAFDSTTQGAAQLVFKAHIRTLSIDKLREIIAIGGKSFQAVIKQVEMIRLFQANEGLTLLDASDKFESHQYAFGGLADMLLQFGQQVAGALQIPLVRLFGQSPVGLSATGESDFRNYYDGIAAQQESRLRRPLHKVFELLSRSCLGAPLPPDFSFKFTPLWQMSALEKADLAERNTDTVIKAFEAGIVTQVQALEELRTSSRTSGTWTSITDEVIQQAINNPVAPMPQQAGPNEPPMGNSPAVPGTSPISTPQPKTPGDEVLNTDQVEPLDQDDGSSGETILELDIHLPDTSGEITVQAGKRTA